MSSVTVSVEERVGVVTITRPEVMNALSSAVLDELEVALRGLAADEAVGCVVLTGAGERAFIAGADIAEMRTKTPLEARAYASKGHGVASLIETMPKPVIAAINGFALGGGCELACACDLRFCSPNARFGQPEINLGIIPGWGGSQRLARTTSLGFAKELVLTGRMVTADEALERGLVNAIHPLESLLDEVTTVARGIAMKSPLALDYAKQATNRALAGDLAANLEREIDLFSILFSTEDTREGLGAFVEKRQAHFKGR